MKSSLNLTKLRCLRAVLSESEKFKNHMKGCLKIYDPSKNRQNIPLFWVFDVTKITSQCRYLTPGVPANQYFQLIGAAFKFFFF